MPADINLRLLMAVFARMDTAAMALAIGAVGALGMFLATATLLLQGAPQGLPVGPHLSDLATLLPGYEVSWGGGIIGALYGFPVGAVVGFIFAVFWNFAHAIIIGVSVLKGNWLD